MRVLSGSLIAAIALVGAPQVVCQTAVSEPLRWVSDIQQFEEADRVHPPVPGSIVCRYFDRTIPSTCSF